MTDKRSQLPYEEMIAAIEELPGLEQLSEALVKALEPITKQRKLMDLLHGRWLGHALHPALQRCTDRHVGECAGARPDR